MEKEIYKCSRCDEFQSLILQNLLNHYNVVHCNEPNFNVICGVGGCPATFAKYNSFYKHVVRKHQDSYSERNRCEPQPKKTCVLAEDQKSVQSTSASAMEEEQNQTHFNTGSSSNNSDKCDDFGPGNIVIE